MTVVIRCYKHHGDYKPDWNEPHTEFITAKTAAECMRIFHEDYAYNHDVSKETAWQIVDVMD